MMCVFGAAGNAPTPSATPVPTPDANQALVAAAVTMPSEVSLADFTAYLQDAFKSAVLLSMTPVWYDTVTL
jgi:hypothetical protein